MISENFNYKIVMKLIAALLVVSLGWIFSVVYSGYVANKNTSAKIIVDANDIFKTDVEEDIVEEIIVPEIIEYDPLIQALNDAPASVSSLYSGSDYDYFFNNTVFVGDSLSVGFTNYCNANSDSIKTQTTTFLAKEGCSARMMLAENALTRYAKFVPSFNGELTYIEDAIEKLPDTQRVFICYGMNDLVDSSPEKLAGDIEELVNRIKAKSPQVDIHIITVPCIMSHVNYAGLSNTNIIAANHKLAKLCEQNKWGFVNLSEYLMISDLSINPEFSSDNYVHEKMTAYKIWNQVLQNYAYESEIRTNLTTN